MSDADDDVQAAAQPVVPEQPHHLIEQPLLAFQPVHRRVAELLIHRVQVEVDRLALADDLAQQVLEVIPQRVVEVGGQLMGGVPLVDEIPHLTVDRAGAAEIAEQARVGLFQLLGLLFAQLLTQFGAAQQVRGQRPHDGALPDLHPLLDQDTIGEPLARLDDDFRLGQALLRQVGVDGILVGLEVLEPPQVDRLAGAQLADDDPDLGIARPGREVAVGQIAAEVHEFADHIFDVGP